MDYETRDKIPGIYPDGRLMNANLSAGPALLEADAEGSVIPVEAGVNKRDPTGHGSTHMHNTKEDEAWITLLSGSFTNTGHFADSSALDNFLVYVNSIRVLAHTLFKKSKVKRPFLVMYTSENIAEEYLDMLRADGLTPIYYEDVKRENSGSGEVNERDSNVKSDLTANTKETSDENVYTYNQDSKTGSFTISASADSDSTEINDSISKAWWARIEFWRMTKYKKLVYLDADMVALNNPDSLFEIDADFAVPVYAEICIAIMVMRPNVKIYNEMKKTLLKFQRNKQFDSILIRSVDQSFHHSFWYYRGLQAAGTFEHPELQSPGNKHNNYGSLETSGSSSEKTSIESDPCDRRVTGRVPIRRPLMELKETFTPEEEKQTGSFKVCILPLQYHVAVTYSQIRPVIDEPHLFAVREADVYEIIGRPEKYATFVHWPGSVRKPWNHWNELCRTYYDEIWWTAYDEYVVGNPSKIHVNMVC